MAVRILDFILQSHFDHHSQDPASSEAYDLIQVEELSWHIDDKVTKPAIIEDLSFTIKSGETVGILGPNGAGKSTLLRCLYRFLKPTSGKVKLCGEDIWNLSPKSVAQSIAVILQEQGEQMGLRVRDVIAQGLIPRKSLFELNQKSDFEKVEANIKTYQLENLANQPFSLLSGGEKQRVAIARAMVQEPDILIMDEPTNHLDVHYQIEVMQRVKSLKNKANYPITVIASFHDLNVASAYCDRVMVIDGGKLVAMGSPSEILTEERLKKVFSVDTKIDDHPFNDHPRVTFNYQVAGKSDFEQGSDHD